MMNQITGPHFCAQLPFEWGDENTDVQPSDWELIRYLMVLADFEQNTDAIELAQAKQDLLLLWLAKSQNIQLPPTQSVCVGMDRICWQSLQLHQVSDQGVIHLALSTQFPLLLKLPAQIVQAEPQGDIWNYTAQLDLSTPLADHFEQAVFRYHRRAIQQVKSHT
ncbi:hypothetical protein HZU75_16200 [Chitinibacter fontanus]|uniref:Cyclic di-GMP receptor atypical PilZ domain-containing protein n=1 Tax=Chitinibacter fontanus TaxID=1737446 RepID=A0A7D5VBT3_9NEIS|nr:PilZ domain-containing protein [Chitinibacter fontanus]QLI82936.1 hypothetical protein HZU75_16200 [Chitinibacter fontanus]